MHGGARGAVVDHPEARRRLGGREHGLGNQIEGFYSPGQRTVVIEDLISTGKSSLQVVDVLEDSGLKIEGMVSIFNYGFQAAESEFTRRNLKYFSLTNYPTLIDLALEKSMVGKEQEAILLNWRADPANWNGFN